VPRTAAERLTFATVRPPLRLDVVGTTLRFAREPSSVCNLLGREAAALSADIAWVSPGDRRLGRAVGEAGPSRDAVLTLPDGASLPCGTPT
jgi:hypothetical protein